MSLQRRCLRTLVARYGAVEVRIADPGLLLDHRVLDALRDPPAVVTAVRLGTETFRLELPFDAAALALVVASCESYRLPDDGPGIGPHSHPTRTNDRLPSITPCSKARQRASTTASEPSLPSVPGGSGT